MPPGCDKKDFVRWRDSMRRDFTINRLLLIFCAYNVIGMGGLKFWVLNYEEFVFSPMPLMCQFH